MKAYRFPQHIQTFFLNLEEYMENLEYEQGAEYIRQYIRHELKIVK